ncbi:MAG TPA: bacteriohemerythrin [Patescibacteria group bacterium]|nr:bacteriohemerythrin [Patescibacteria group bacterium]
MVFWKWDDSYLTNVSAMDARHRKLIDMFNELYASVIDCEDLKEENALTRQILENLISYGKEHFAEEEELLLQYAYPELQAHKEEHERFRSHIADLVAQYERGEVALSFPVFVFLKEWIEEHVLKVDQLYGPYLNERGVR